MDTTNVHPPGALTEMLGRLAYAFAEIQPFLPMYTHLILSALFPIVTGAHASLSRPSSAAKPAKKKKKKKGTNEDGNSDDESEDESLSQKMEGLSPSDAILFPIMAGCTLAGLYFLIQYAGPQMLNKILGWYFSCMGVFSVAKLVNDGLAVAGSLLWPRYYVDGQALWRVDGVSRSTVQVSHGGEMADDGIVRTSPLPGLLGRVPLSKSIARALWLVRELPGRKYLVRGYIYGLPPLRSALTLRLVLSSLVGLAVPVYTNLVRTPWWLTNLQGFAFSYSALQLMSPTTFGTGSLILCALFFYDIYFVFYTPMMVTVAGNLDVPIKLLFPRPAEEGEAASERRLAMLGLGDVVLPGIMIGLALRFDLYMHYLRKQTPANAQQEPAAEVIASSTDASEAESNNKKPGMAPYQRMTGLWGDRLWTSTGLLVTQPMAARPSPTTRASINALLPSFSKPYFYASITGYVAGMCVTLGIMQVYQHAQPALLYLVPGVLGSLWCTALVRGEMKVVWEFSEAVDEVAGDEGKQGEEGKSEKNGRKKVEVDGQDTGDATATPWFDGFKAFFSSPARPRLESKEEPKKVAATLLEQDGAAPATAAAKEVETGDDAKHALETKPKPKSKSRHDNSVTDSDVFFFSISRHAPGGMQQKRRTKPTQQLSSSNDSSAPAPSSPSSNLANVSAKKNPANATHTSSPTSDGASDSESESEHNSDSSSDTVVVNIADLATGATPVTTSVSHSDASAADESGARATPSTRAGSARVTRSSAASGAEPGSDVGAGRAGKRQRRV